MIKKDCKIFCIVYSLVAALTIVLAIPGCQSPAKPPEEVVIVDEPEDVLGKAQSQLTELLGFIGDSGGKLNDSTLISNVPVIDSIYEAGGFQPLWSDAKEWRASGDTLFNMISQAKLYGLFPADYHLPALLSIRNQLVIDTLARKNVALWTKADLLLTDAFLKLATHLKYGQLESDSISLRPDTAFAPEKLASLLQEAISGSNPRSILEALEPANQPYRAIRAALPAFLDSLDFRNYLEIPYPNEDSLEHIRNVALRLQEEGLLDQGWTIDDADSYVTAVKKYQQSNGIPATGFAAELTVKSLNFTDSEKFRTIAINLHRYRQLPDTMPETYIMVNLPAYQLRVYDYDTVVMESRIIVGAAKTPTPVLNSQITNVITYPQWTVPYSIIFREMLPKIQKDIGYLAKQNLMVVDKYDSVISPETIDWTKLNRKNFPYLLRQRQGDDNSLGVMKFNFRNKYSVYLHDTNARGLFTRNARALSHGCVRVQEWEKLSHFLVRNDEIRYHPDTIRAWISRQEKHVISDFSHIPIYIRYFTCEAGEKGLRFFADIYGIDKILSEKHFKSKPVN